MNSQIDVRFIQTGYTRQRAALAYKGDPWKTIRFPALVTLMRHPKHGIILFDTGYSQHFHDATEKYPERLYGKFTPVTTSDYLSAKQYVESCGYEAGDVKYVICSHFHADHISGLKDFPKATFIASKEGFEQLETKSRLNRLLSGFLIDLVPDDFSERLIDFSHFDIAPVFSGQQGEDSFSYGYDLFGDGFITAIPLPGHSCGHYGLLVKDRFNQDFLLAGDASWSAKAISNKVGPSSLAHLILQGGDQRAYDQTLRKLHQTSALSPKTMIIPCHCTKTIANLPHQNLGAL